MEIVKIVPLVAFVSYITKVLLTVPSANDVGVIAALAGVAALQIFVDKKKSVQDVRDECLKQLEEIRVVINKQSEVINLQAVEFAKLKNDMSGIKLKNDFKSVEGFGTRKVG